MLLLLTLVAMTTERKHPCKSYLERMHHINSTFLLFFMLFIIQIYKVAHQVKPIIIAASGIVLIVSYLVSTARKWGNIVIRGVSINWQTYKPRTFTNCEHLLTTNIYKLHYNETSDRTLTNSTQQDNNQPHAKPWNIEGTGYNIPSLGWWWCRMAKTSQSLWVQSLPE